MVRRGTQAGGRLVGTDRPAITRAGHMPPNRTSEPHAGRVVLVTGAALGIGQAIAAGSRRARNPHRSGHRCTGRVDIAAIKSKYDPQNLFHHNVNIQPAKRAAARTTRVTAPTWT